MRKISAVLFLLFFLSQAFSQTQQLDNWVENLTTADDQQSLRFGETIKSIRKYPDPEQAKIIPQLEAKIKDARPFGIARYNMLKAYVLYDLYVRPPKYPYMKELNQSMAIANDLDDDILMADICYWYSGAKQLDNEVGQAMFYALKSIELVEKTGAGKFYAVGHRYDILGNLLYHTREYDKSIEYSLKAVNNKVEPVDNRNIASCYNTVGLCYKKLGNTDSALWWFNTTAQLALQQKQFEWINIANANKAQVLFTQKKYDEARVFFEADYASSLKYEPDNAANNLQWLAKIDLATARTDSAVFKANQALHLLQKRPNSSYQANTYQTLAEIYSQLNNKENSIKYLELYNHIHDSIERVMAANQSDILQLRLNDENNKFRIEVLEKEKQVEKIKLLSFVGILLLGGLIGWLQYRKNRMKTLKEQQLKDAALLAAKEKMEFFTRAISEKSELIEKLQAEVELHKTSPALQEHLQEIKQKTILTENDWDEFKTTFEKIYPGFFNRLQTSNKDITTAELRFAALIRLQMNNRQAGAILGISADSARKTRQRLRQRLHISEELNLEEYVLNI